MALWFTLAAMLLIALLFVLPPLLRKQKVRGPGRDELNLILHRQRLAELEADRDNGSLSAAQFAQAQKDLERDLVTNLDEGGTPTSSDTGLATAVMLLIAVPALSFGLYLQFGAWNDLDSPAAMATRAQPAAQAGNGAAMPGQMQDGTNLPPIDQLADKLAAKLKDDPTNAEGWVMLGRTYVHLQRFGEAEQAYGKAYALLGDEVPQLLVDYAESMALANDDTLAGAPARLIDKALAAEPENEKALWLAGMAAMQMDKPELALKHWEHLQQLIPQDTENMAVLTPYMNHARERLGMEPLPPVAELEPIMPPRGAAPAPAAAGKGPSIAVTVKLDPALAGKASPSDLVFIYAKAASGPPMPLAAARMTVADLPVTVTLDDSMAMMPAMKLSSFEKVIVGARISKSGNPIAQSGDLEGDAGVVSAMDTDSVTVSIDSIKP